MRSSVSRIVDRLEELANAQDAAFLRGDVEGGVAWMDAREVCLRELDAALLASPRGPDEAEALRRARRRSLLTRRLARRSLGALQREIAGAGHAAAGLTGYGARESRSRHLDCTG